MLDLVGNPNCWFCHAQAHSDISDIAAVVQCLSISQVTYGRLKTVLLI